MMDSKGLLFDKVYNRISFDSVNKVLYHRTDIKALTCDGGILSGLLSQAHSKDEYFNLRLSNCRSVYGDDADGKYGAKYLSDFYKSLQCPIKDSILNEAVDDYRSILQIICFCPDYDNDELLKYGEIALGFDAVVLSHHLQLHRCIYEDLPTNEVRFYQPDDLDDNPQRAKISEQEVNRLPGLLLSLCKHPKYYKEKEVRGCCFVDSYEKYSYIRLPRKSLVDIRICKNSSSTSEMKNIANRYDLDSLLHTY